MINFLGELKSTNEKDTVKEKLYYEAPNFDNINALYKVDGGFFIANDALSDILFSVNTAKEDLEQLQLEYEILNKKYQMALEKLALKEK